MNYLNRKAVQLFSVLLFLPLGIASAADRGLYIGGSVGQATLELPVVEGFGFDEDDAAWKVLLGYNFELGPLNVGVEGGYINLGEPSFGDSTALIEFEPTGYDVFGVAGIEVGPIDLFAKVGAIAWDVEGRISGSDIPDALQVSLSDSGTDLAYGVGASFNLSRFSVRAEYEGFDIEDTDTVYMLSLGLVYRF
jgi:outer membrane immunogenic protein